MYYRLLVRVLECVARFRCMVLPRGMSGRHSRDRSRMIRDEAFTVACTLLTFHGLNRRAAVTPAHLAVYFAKRKDEERVYDLLFHLLRGEGVPLEPGNTAEHLRRAFKGGHVLNLDARGAAMLNLAAWPAPLVRVHRPPPPPVPAETLPAGYHVDALALSLSLAGGRG